MKKITKKRPFSLKRFVGIMLLSLVLLLLSVIVFLFFSAEQLIHKNISRIVFEKTDSTYRFNFESIDLELFKRSIRLNNINLEPDSLVKADSTKSYYLLHSPFLSIESIDYMALLRDLKFKAGKFSIESPKFSMSSGKDIGLKDFAEKNMKLGDTLSLPFLSEIVFDTLLVVDARLNIDSIFLEKYELPKVNLEVLNFRMGGIKKTSTPFPFDVDDLSLKVENIADELPDSVHLLKVEQINLSLMYSTIKAKNIHLGKKPGSINSLENIYTIDIPELVMFSKDVQKFYLTDTLTIDSMLLKDPAISILFGQKVKEGTPPNEINLYKLFEDRWNWVKLKQLTIQNGDVKFFPNKSGKETQRFENLNVVFQDFMIDRNSYRDETRILSAKSLVASLSKFTLYHTDKVHVFTIEDIVADTKNQFLTSKTVKFEPINDSKHSKLPTKINISCKELSFKGFNYLEFYHHQRIPMQEMIIQSPAINVHFDQPQKIEMAIRDKSIILEKTRDYLTGIYVGTTRIKNGSVAYNYNNLENKSGFYKSHFDFELKKLSIDSVTFYQSDKIFFANEFQIKFSDIDLLLADNKHQLQTKSIQLSSTNQSAEIIDFRIFPIENQLNADTISNNELFTISFPRIQFSGANLHKAFFEKNLYIENFSIESPTFSYKKKGDWKATTPEEPFQRTVYSLVDQYLFNVQIENLSMDNGNLQILQQIKNEPDFSFSNAFSIKLTNFELNEQSATNKNKLFFSDHIDLILKNQELKLADGVHKVNAEEIGILSSKNELYIKNASLAPDMKSPLFKKLPISVFATIPELRMTLVNILELINEGTFNVGTVSFNQPEIKLLIQKLDGMQEPADEKKPILILEGIENFSSNRIVINGGSLEIANFDDGKSNTFSKTKIGFEMDNFNINLHNKDYLTTYSDFNVFLSDLSYQLPDNVHTLTASTLNYHMTNKLMEVTDFMVKTPNQMAQTEDKQYFNFILPEIRLSGFDPEALIRKKKLKANSLFIQKPIVKINDQRKENKKPFSPYKIDLYTTLQPFIENIEIKDVTLNSATVDKTGENPFHLKNFDLTAENLKVDEQNKRGNTLIFSDKFNLKTSTFKGKTKDGFYTYNINYITLNEKGDFSINGLELKPIYTKKEFVRLRKFQADYFNIEKLELAGTGLNLKRLFDDNQIWIDLLKADFTDVKIHRDKTVPLDPNLFIKLPQQALREMKQKINIKKTKITCNDFLYTELIADEQIPILVNFSEVRAEVENISNIKEIIDLNQKLKATFDAKLMKVGDTHIEMNLNLPSPKNQFTINGVCDSMPLSLLNPVTEAGLKLSIKEGYNRKFETYFEANEDSSFGTLGFDYAGLKLSVLNDRDGKMHEDKLVSFFANTFVKTENPKPGKQLIPVEAKYYRNKKQSIIAYSWKTIFTGLSNTFGLKDKEDNE